ncbi:MAG TPA: glycosyltransferase family 4 protein [Terriglobia bacterium]|nr:glycosyltransferase family 4 protein [Terriglobia bacterium]
MRITFAMGDYAWKVGGGYRVVYTYANHLVARGHQVAILHPSHARYLPPPRGLYRWVRRRVGMLRNFLWRPRRKWQRIDNRIQMLHAPDLSAKYFPDADAVFATAWFTAFDINDLPPNKGEKFYLIQHYETWMGPKDLVDRTWLMPLHKVTVSKWLRDLSLDMGSQDVVHIPNGIDHSRFRLLTPIQSRPRRVVLLYSRLDWKGAAEGIEAIERAKQRYPDLRAVLFGVFPRPRGLPSWVEFIKNPSLDVLVGTILNGSSVFLSPSWYEGWPLAPAEAMACGCAIVAADSKGIRDYCDDQITALLSEPKDVSWLTANLLRVLEDDGLRIRLAEAGHRKIQEFTWERSTEMLEEHLSNWVAARSLR